MKKHYTTPEANLLCFRPAEDLAIDFSNIYDVTNGAPQYGKQDAAVVSERGDIRLNLK